VTSRKTGPETRRRIAVSVIFMAQYPIFSRAESRGAAGGVQLPIDSTNCRVSHPIAT
jgi:hypothetical protein